MPTIEELNSWLAIIALTLVFPWNRLVPPRVDKPQPVDSLDWALECDPPPV